MAWTTLPTYTAGSVLTAAQMNAIAANILETAAATASAAGSFVYADGQNSMGSEVAHPGAGGYVLFTSGATTYDARYMRSFSLGDGTYTGAGASDDTYLYMTAAGWGSGTGVNVTVTTGTAAWVIYGCGRADPAAAQSISISYDVAGASTISVSDTNRALLVNASDANESSLCRITLETGLTAGSNIFRLLAKASDISVAEIGRPYIGVIPA